MEESIWMHSGAKKKGFNPFFLKISNSGVNKTVEFYNNTCYLCSKSVKNWIVTSQAYRSIWKTHTLTVAFVGRIKSWENRKMIYGNTCRIVSRFFWMLGSESSPPWTVGNRIPPRCLLSFEGTRRLLSCVTSTPPFDLKIEIYFE